MSNAKFLGILTTIFFIISAIMVVGSIGYGLAEIPVIGLLTAACIALTISFFAWLIVEMLK